jgi:hypothetical protein
MAARYSEISASSRSLLRISPAALAMESCDADAAAAGGAVVAAPVPPPPTTPLLRATVEVEPSKSDMWVG